MPGSKRPIKLIISTSFEKSIQLMLLSSNWWNVLRTDSPLTFRISITMIERGAKYGKASCRTNLAIARSERFLGLDRDYRTMDRIAWTWIKCELFWERLFETAFISGLEFSWLPYYGRRLCVILHDVLCTIAPSSGYTVRIFQLGSSARAPERVRYLGEYIFADLS